MRRRGALSYETKQLPDLSPCPSPCPLKDSNFFSLLNHSKKKVIFSGNVVLMSVELEFNARPIFCVMD